MSDLTIEQIAALDYTGPSASTQGLTGAEVQAYHREHGEQFRAWSGYQAPEGVSGPNGEVRERDERVYIEEDLPPAMRGMIFDEQIQVNDRDFGVITVWQTKISVLPWEFEFVHGDRVLPLSPNRAKPDRCLLQPGKTELPALWVSKISRVLVDGEDFGDYDLETDEDGTSRLLGLPNSICSVKFKYQPLYVWSNLGNRTPPMGTDGLALAQIGILTQRQKKR